MPLTNSQYESILRNYEGRQTKNRHILNERIEQVYTQVNGYKELDSSVSSISVECGKRMLEGDENAMSDLKEKLRNLTEKKKQLLTAAGFPEDYLSPIYDCPDCQDTGYINGEKCHCFKQQMISILYEQSNIHEMLETENFSNLSYEYYSGEELSAFERAVQTSKSFIKEFDKNYQNLFFYGTVGCGKSFLSGCIAKELIETGHSIIYFSSIGLFEFLSRYSFDYKNKENLYNAFEDLYNCDLVIIDDLGTEVTNSFVTSQLFSCLNERHIRKKSTVISTNLSLEELRERYSDRIFSRITSNYTVCRLSGPDIRLKKLFSKTN